MRSFLGIDLGTTMTLAAAVAPAPPAGGRAGRSGVPTVVGLRHSGAVLSRMAVDAASQQTIRCAKSVLGDPDRRVRLRSAEYVRPEEVMAEVLIGVLADAQQALDEPVTDAVLTVPASFDFMARRALRDAAAIAGLRVRHVVTEHVAAALAYRGRLRRDQTVLTFDLGGGGFTASLLRLGAGSVEVRAAVGDRRLGGWDWDNLLMLVLQERLTAAGGPDLLGPETEDRLRQRARAAKHRLSSALRTEVPLDHGGRRWWIPVTRVEFETATSRVLARTSALLEDLLRAASVGPGGIDRVLLVGSHTRMPAVSRLLRPLGAPLDRSVTPGQAVALGAASYGRAVRVTEVASHGLGVLARSSRTGALRNVPILPSGTPLPATRSAVLTTGEDGAGWFIVEVTLGDGVDPGVVRTVHREVIRLTGEPGCRIELRCHYDRAEVPSVEVWAADRNCLVSRFVVPSRAGMGRAELRAAAHRVLQVACSARGPASSAPRTG